MNLLASKILSIVILGLASFFIGLLPAWLANQSRRQWPLLLSCLLCFGGGVLLSTSVIHILPEMRESSPKEMKQYCELIFCLGFFILYMLDEIVHYFYGDTHEVIILQNSAERSHVDGRRHSATSKYTYGATESDSLINKPSPYNPSFGRARSDSILFLDPPPSQLCHVGHQEPCHAAPTSNIGLLVALSVHALLEGLVVGLEELPSKVLLLLGAIASHKLVVTFCLGMELSSNSTVTFCRHITYILIFTLGSVSGIAIGMLLSNIPSTLTNVVIPSLQGLAGGTLLYVTVSEIIPRERARWHQQLDKKAAGIFQFVSVGFGFVIMTAISQYLDYGE